MNVAEKSIIFTNLWPHLVLKKNGRKSGRISAKRRDLQQQQQFNFPLKFSKKTLAKSVVAVLGLGFIDAGYSGDWTRIGVISKDSEDLLKLVAFLVVPSCLLFIFSSSKEHED